MKNKISQGDPALARRIRAARIPIYIGEDDGGIPQIPSSGLLVYQEGEVIENRAFDFCGTAGYIVRVVITVNLPRFAIAEFGLELPWESDVRWLQDPYEIGGGRTVDYRFGGKEPLEFDGFERSEVLNHLADVRRMWSRGQSLKGYLLGIGNERIPDQYQPGEEIPAFLIVYNQFMRGIRTPISLWTLRTKKTTKQSRSGMQRTGDVIDQPNLIAQR
jgi:hypothetical protein